MRGGGEGGVCACHVSAVACGGPWECGGGAAAECREGTFRASLFWAEGDAWGRSILPPAPYTRSAQLTSQGPPALSLCAPGHFVETELFRGSQPHPLPKQAWRSPR